MRRTQKQDWLAFMRRYERRAEAGERKDSWDKWAGRQSAEDRSLFTRLGLKGYSYAPVRVSAKEERLEEYEARLAAREALETPADPEYETFLLAIDGARRIAAEQMERYGAPLPGALHFEERARWRQKPRYGRLSHGKYQVIALRALELLPPDVEWSYWITERLDQGRIGLPGGVDELTRGALALLHREAERFVLRSIRRHRNTRAPEWWSLKYAVTPTGRLALDGYLVDLPEYLEPREPPPLELFLRNGGRECRRCHRGFFPYRNPRLCDHCIVGGDEWITELLATDAKRAGFDDLDAFTAPAPRGKPSKREKRRLDALAASVQALRSMGATQRLIADAMGTNTKRIHALEHRNLGVIAA